MPNVPDGALRLISDTVKTIVEERDALRTELDLAKAAYNGLRDGVSNLLSGCNALLTEYPPLS